MYYTDHTQITLLMARDGLREHPLHGPLSTVLSLNGITDGANTNLLVVCEVGGEVSWIELWKGERRREENEGTGRGVGEV